MHNNNELWIPPISKPTIDPEFPYLSPLQRCGEVFRFSYLSFEHAVSPGGGLRKILRSIGMATLIALMVLPVVCLVGIIAATVAGIVSNLLFIVIGGGILYIIIRVILKK